MAGTTSYLIFLSPPLSTPEQIKEICGLSQLPEVRPVEEAGLDDEEQDLRDGQGTTQSRCCIVDRSAKDAIVDWARSSGATIKPVIPIFLTEPADTTHAMHTRYPAPYFLSGALASSGLLQTLLDLEQVPVLQSARVEGYRIIPWNGKDALVASSGHNFVQGIIYMAQSEEEVEKLAEHEGFAFEVMPHIVNVNGEVIEANLFRYRGEKLGLENLQGQAGSAFPA